jgi:hypothetical protein
VLLALSRFCAAVSAARNTFRRDVSTTDNQGDADRLMLPNSTMERRSRRVADASYCRGLHDDLGTRRKSAILTQTDADARESRPALPAGSCCICADAVGRPLVLCECSTVKCLTHSCTLTRLPCDTLRVPYQYTPLHTPLGVLMLARRACSSTIILQLSSPVKTWFSKRRSL